MRNLQRRYTHTVFIDLHRHAVVQICESQYSSMYCFHSCISVAFCFEADRHQTVLVTCTRLFFGSFSLIESIEVLVTGFKISKSPEMWSSHLIFASRGIADEFHSA